MAKIGINGFGRIGRMVLRAALDRGTPVGAINTPGVNPEYLAYLFKFDSTHGVFRDSVCVHKNCLEVCGQKIALAFETEAEKICWKDYDVGSVAECSGKYTTIEQACKHFYGGANKVIISAPSKDAPEFVVGVNLDCYKPCMKIISNSSGSTNCLAPLAKVLHCNFEIVEAFVTVVHAVTAKQPVLDAMRARWRIGRASLNNIIPTSTGAATSIGKILPELDCKIGGLAFRVPVKNVSAIAFTVRFEKDTDIKTIREKVKAASEREMKGILGFTDDDVVSTDFNGITVSSILDTKACISLNHNFFKIISWFDNEVSYANRMLDLIEFTCEADAKYEEERKNKKSKGPC